MDTLLHGAEIPSAAHGWVPRVDIRETADEILVSVELPGVGREDIEVTVEGSYLRVAGVRPEPTSETCVRWHQMEITYGPFERVINLPCEIDPDRISATYQDGFLRIQIPREIPGARQVPIDST